MSDRELFEQVDDRVHDIYLLGYNREGISDSRNRIEQIIALVRADMARQLLSDETTGVLAERLLWMQIDGVMPELNAPDEERADDAWAVIEDIQGLALAAIGLGEEDV